MYSTNSIATITVLLLNALPVPAQFYPPQAAGSGFGGFNPFNPYGYFNDFGQNFHYSRYPPNMYPGIMNPYGYGMFGDMFGGYPDFNQRPLTMSSGNTQTGLRSLHGRSANAVKQFKSGNSFSTNSMRSLPSSASCIGQPGCLTNGWDTESMKTR